MAGTAMMQLSGACCRPASVQVAALPLPGQAFRWVFLWGLGKAFHG